MFGVWFGGYFVPSQEVFGSIGYGSISYVRKNYISIYDFANLSTVRPRFWDSDWNQHHMISTATSQSQMFSCAFSSQFSGWQIPQIWNMFPLNGYGSKLGTPKLWMVNTKLDIHICGPLNGLPFWPTRPYENMGISKEDHPWGCVASSHIWNTFSLWLWLT